MKISEAASRVNIPASTIRYYESLGLLRSLPRVSGQRHLDEGAVNVLQFIALAKSAGFSLDEIKRLRKGYDAKKPPSRLWQKLAEEKRDEVLGQIRQLEGVVSILDEMLECRCATVSDCIARAADPVKDLAQR